MTTYRTILVATDGSDNADRAFVEGLELAVRHDAALHAIAVVDTKQFPETARSIDDLLLGDAEDEVSERLTTLAERGETEGVTTTVRSCHGDPAEQILAYADEIDADIVVIGKRGLTHRIRDGTVVKLVTEQSTRPVATY